MIYMHFTIWKHCPLTPSTGQLLYKGLSGLLNSAFSVSNYVPTSGHQTVSFSFHLRDGFSDPLLTDAASLPGDAPSKAVGILRQRKKEIV